MAGGGGGVPARAARGLRGASRRSPGRRRRRARRKRQVDAGRPPGARGAAQRRRAHRRRRLDHSFFDWSDLLLDDVLRPAREGRAVHYRPPAWDQRGRAGAIEVPAGTRWLFVEGTGAARRELDGFLDAVVWVQSDDEEAERAGIARDVERGVNGDLEQATVFWHRWQSEEVPFMDDHRPWERADVVVAGVGLPRAGDGRVLVGGAPRAG